MPVDQAAAIQDVLILRTHSHICAIASSRIAELILMASLIRPPGQPGILDGFLNLRGEAVPVVPLHRLFQQEAPEPEVYTPLVVVRVATGLLALRVDSVDGVAAVDAAAIVPYASADSLNGCAEGQFHWQGHEIVLLSPELLLLAKERACIFDLQTLVQERLKNLEAPPA